MIKLNIYNKNDNSVSYEMKSLNFEIPSEIGNNPIIYKYIEETSSFLFYYNFC